MSVKLLGNGSSILFTGPAACGKSWRIRDLLLNIAYEKRIVIYASNQSIPKLLAMMDTHQGNQVIIHANYYPENITKYKEEFEKRKIEVISMEHNAYLNESHRNSWAKSWLLYRNPDTQISELKDHLEAGNKDLFEFLPLEKSADLEKIISLYLMGVDLSGQKDYRADYVRWLKNYVDQVVIHLYHLQVLDLTRLTISYL